MAHDADQIKADFVAVSKGRCPETGRDISGRSPDELRAYAQVLFPQWKSSELAKTDYMRRFRLLMKRADDLEASDKAGK